jgi:DNA-directed RNA polymerase subunit RPC12/RpoP
MDYRCPVCRENLGKRRVTQAVVTRMEIDCPRCKSKVRLRVHVAEEIVVLLSFGTIVVLAAFAYWFQSQGLVIAALGAAMLGALALPLLEQTYLRHWPRYAAIEQKPVDQAGA